MRTPDLRFWQRPCALALALMVFATRSKADEPLNEMLRRVPDTANALAVIDVKALNNSPVAKRQGWKDRRQVLTDNTSFLPKNVDKIVMASTIDLASMKNTWNLAVVDLSVNATTDALIRAERGARDQVGGREVVWTPRNAYLVLLKSRLLAQFSPANRQELARWLKLESQSAVPKLSGFLDQATNDVGRSGQMVVALNLEDAFLPGAIREFLKTSTALPPKSDLDKISNVLASIKGFRMTVSADEDVNGVLTVEFREPVAPLGESAKAILLEALTGLGAEVEDLPKWSAMSVGTTVVMKGKLSEGAITRILSLFDLPNQADLPESPGAAPAEPKQTTVSMAQATKRYYSSIGTILDDLKHQKSTGQTGTALWYGRYARKIDQLPVLHVDPDLVRWAQDLTDGLRKVSTAYDGVSSATNYRQTVSYSGYGYGGGSNVTAADSARIRKQEDIYAVKVSKDTWSQIDSQFAAMRKTLTLKYQIEF
jgi:hypothetical protein